jgi:POT family proton-dependent oligopeptide transporter
MSNPTKKHPSGLYLLYFTEMWERFSYYGMRAIFTLYMINALLFDKALASSIYGSYTGLVYLTPLLGGYIADRYWGNRKSIIFGGALMAVGQFLMFMSGSLFESVESAKLFMYSGLGFLIFGNGFFKPNISTMVGQLYPKNDSRLDSAMTIFYQGINLGALIAPLVCGNLGEVYDSNGIIVPAQFKWGFLAACLGMIISLITFIILKNKYVIGPEGASVGMPPKFYKSQEDILNAGPKAKIPFNKIIAALVGYGILFYIFFDLFDFDLIGSLIFTTCIILPAVIITDSTLTPDEKSRIWVIYIIAFFVIFFWSAFEQAGASLTFFAQEQTDRMIFGWNMPASLFQMFNALFIVVLAPVTVSIWSFLAARGKEPASPVKQSMGLGFLAIGYLFIAWGVYGVQPWDKVSMMWLIGLYLIHTIGELCLSPIGLSMVVKLAPARFVSLLMGVWFMSTATANKFAGELSALYPEDVKIEKQIKSEGNQTSLLSTLKLDDAIWDKSPKENFDLPVIKYLEDGKNLTSVSLEDGKTKEVSVYHLKLIRTSNAKFNNAAVSEDGNYLISVREGGLTDIWNLNPLKPKFLGFQINDLFDFFMIFVYMAGAASILLFLISGRLIVMMRGIR